MKKIVILVFTGSYSFLTNCTDANDFSIESQFVIVNQFAEKVTIELYPDNSYENPSKVIELNPTDSLLLYVCQNPKSEGACHPFDGDNASEITADYGSFIFDDQKRLNFDRDINVSYNLLREEYYDETLSISNRLIIICYKIDQEEYLLAE